MCLCPKNKCGGQCKGVGLFLLRLALASIFIYAVYNKLGPGHDGAVGMFKALGFGAPEFWAYFVGLAEVIGGAMLILGVYVCYAAAWLAIIIVVALLTAHRGGPFMSLFAPIATLGGLFALIGTGAGKLSVMGKKCEENACAPKEGCCNKKAMSCTCGKCDSCKTKIAK